VSVRERASERARERERPLLFADITQNRERERARARAWGRGGVREGDHAFLPTSYKTQTERQTERGGGGERERRRERPLLFPVIIQNTVAIALFRPFILCDSA